MCGSTLDIQSAAGEEIKERKKKKKPQDERMKI